MPKTLDIQGFSGLREEVVRSEGCTPCTPAEQALTVYFSFFKEHSLYVGALFCRAAEYCLCPFFRAVTLIAARHKKTHLIPKPRNQACFLLI